MQTSCFHRKNRAQFISHPLCMVCVKLTELINARACCTSVRLVITLQNYPIDCVQFATHIKMCQIKTQVWRLALPVMGLTDHFISYMFLRAILWKNNGIMALMSKMHSPRLSHHIEYHMQSIITTANSILHQYLILDRLERRLFILDCVFPFPDGMTR